MSKLGREADGSVVLVMKLVDSSIELGMMQETMKPVECKILKNHEQDKLIR